MSIYKKLLSYLTSPQKCVSYIKNRVLHSSYGKKMGDEEYLKRMFKLKMGYELDLENPQTYNEKLQWLKINYHNPDCVTMVDKYLSKQYVADRIGQEYVVPLYGYGSALTRSILMRFRSNLFSKLPMTVAVWWYVRIRHPLIKRKLRSFWKSIWLTNIFTTAESGLIKM